MIKKFIFELTVIILQVSSIISLPSCEIEYTAKVKNVTVFLGSDSSCTSEKLQYLYQGPATFWLSEVENSFLYISTVGRDGLNCYFLELNQYPVTWCNGKVQWKVNKNVYAFESDFIPRGKAWVGRLPQYFTSNCQEQKKFETSRCATFTK